MLLLREYNSFSYKPEDVVRNESDGTMMVSGIIQRADAENQNGRVYPYNILLPEIKNYMKLIREKRAFGELDHCLDDESEIYTTSGWKYLKDISDKEEIYTLDKDGYIEKKTIKEKIVVPWNGPMYHFHSKKRIDLCVSPNHRMLFWDRDNVGYESVAEVVATELQEKNSYLSHSHLKTSGIWDGKMVSDYTIPGTNYTMSAETWMGLLGIWLAEGFAAGTKGSKKTTSNIVGIVQKKSEQINLIRNLLAQTNMPWKERQRQDGTVDFLVIDPQVHDFFFSLGNSYTKYIPNEFLDWSPDLLEELLKWMLLGDGRNRLSPTRELVREYSTISPALAAGVEELFFKLGSSSNTHVRIQQDSKIKERVIKGINCKPLYTVAENKTVPHFDARFVTCDKIDYNGMIYCVSVENRNFLTRRRNGIPVWTGNCDSPIVNMKNVSHMIVDIWEDGKDIYGKVKVLDTPMGLIVQSIIKAGGVPGISSRALGSVEKRNGVDVVQDDLQILCWDFVSEPSTHGAFMRLSEAKEIDPSVLKEIFTKSDRVDRILNEVLNLE